MAALEVALTLLKGNAALLEVCLRLQYGTLTNGGQQPLVEMSHDAAASRPLMVLPPRVLHVNYRAQSCTRALFTPQPI